MLISISNEKTSTILALLLVGSFATFAKNPETGCPYVKTHIGLQKDQSITAEPGAFKSNVNVTGTIALGYNLADNMRSDLNLERYFNLNILAQYR